MSTNERYTGMEPSKAFQIYCNFNPTPPLSYAERIANVQYQVWVKLKEQLNGADKSDPRVKFMLSIAENIIARKQGAFVE